MFSSFTAGCKFQIQNLQAEDKLQVFVFPLFLNFKVCHDDHWNLRLAGDSCKSVISVCHPSAIWMHLCIENNKNKRKEINSMFKA